MRRVGLVFAVIFAVLAFAAPVSADTGPAPGEKFRQSHEAIGFDAFTTECGGNTCTDTYVYAEEVTLSSGETFEYVCIDRYTYRIRTGQLTSEEHGCADTTNLTVADDLSAATLAPTEVEVCGDGRSCDTVTVSAEMQAVGDAEAFRSRGSFRDGTCHFTFSDSGQRRQASGTLTIDGETTSADGGIWEYKSTWSERCR